MAEFKGFACDSCGTIWTNDNKTTAKLTFAGARAGTFVRELCPDCAAIDPPGFRNVTRQPRNPLHHEATEVTGD